MRWLYIYVHDGFSFFSWFFSRCNHSSAIVVLVKIEKTGHDDDDDNFDFSYVQTNLKKKKEKKNLFTFSPSIYKLFFCDQTRGKWLFISFFTFL